MHHSLKIYPFKTKKRSVRKRYERIRSLMLQNKWDKEHNSVFGLPKEKIIHVKKGKKKEEEKKEETKT
jgi:small basic protein (TIGR04137 family)